MEEKFCNGCKKSIKLCNFYACKKHKNGYSSRCKECLDKQNKNYSHTIQGKITNQKAVLKYSKTLQGHKAILKAMRKHKKTTKGKISSKRGQAKRKRNLGWILMFKNPFAESVEVEYHHITDVYVVAIPRDLHHQYMGKYHRENTMEIVKQIYLGKD